MLYTMSISPFEYKQDMFWLMDKKQNIYAQNDLTVPILYALKVLY